MFSEAELKRFVPYRIITSPFSLDTTVDIPKKAGFSKVECEIATIFDQEVVRLSPEELKATGPGPESAFVAAWGRRTTSTELSFAHHLHLMKDLLLEWLDYYRLRFIH